MQRRSKVRRSIASACPPKSSCAIARRTSRTSSPAVTTPRPITATCGPRCSTPTHLRRLKRLATFSTPTPPRRCTTTSTLPVARAIRRNCTRPSAAGCRRPMRCCGDAGCSTRSRRDAAATGGHRSVSRVRNSCGRLRLMNKALTNMAALVTLTLTFGTVTAAQTTKTTAQFAIDQFNECAGSLFKDEFEPAEIDYELSLNKEVVLFLSAQWRSRDSTITILTRIRSIGSTIIREMIMTQNGESQDELPPPAAKVKEYIAKVFEECP